MEAIINLKAATIEEVNEIVESTCKSLNYPIHRDGREKVANYNKKIKS